MFAIVVHEAHYGLGQQAVELGSEPKPATVATAALVNVTREKTHTRTEVVIDMRLFDWSPDAQFKRCGAWRACRFDELPIDHSVNGSAKIKYPSNAVASD